MNTYHRRYIFTDFENLKKVKFKKLRKVCDRVFVFISSDEMYIPFGLVQHMQKMGKKLKWIVVENAENKDMTNHISFMMGKMHQKVDKMIEFALLSEDENLDSLVKFINRFGRNCLRVRKDKKLSSKKKGKGGLKFNPVPTVSMKKSRAVVRDNGFTYENKAVKKTASVPTVEKTAEDTIKRLIRSGNRPQDLTLLQEYILSNNSGLSEEESVNKVIRQLEQSNEIRINEGDVIYYF